MCRKGLRYPYQISRNLTTGKEPGVGVGCFSLNCHVSLKSFKNNKSGSISFSPFIISTSLPRAIPGKHTTKDVLWVSWEPAPSPTAC
jgi:hypothetical protein